MNNRRVGTRLHFQPGDIQARRDSIGDVGYEGNINYELLLSLDPDLVLLNGVNGASSMESKLKELGIPFMYVGDYLEESPLGKAEWMVSFRKSLANEKMAKRHLPQYQSIITP